MATERGERCESKECRKSRAPLEPPLVIATNLNAIQNERIAAHWSKPRVIPYASQHPVWEVPPEADVLFTFFAGWRQAPAEAPAGWPFRLTWIQIASAGIDAFPAWVFSVPLVTSGRGVSAVALSEYVLAAILAHEKRFFDGIRVHSAAEWKMRSLGQVEGRTLGVLGLGAIGKAVVARARAFGMRILTVARSSVPEEGIETVGSVVELAARSDHLVLSVPLTRETRGIIDAEVLAAAKPGLHLINVARGELIDHDALLAALDSDRVAAATLDVTYPEPLPEGHPLYTHPKVRLTPHSGWSSDDNADRLTAKLLGNLDRFLDHEPLVDVVDSKRGY
jgi:phosphoglycerate dehydrogenase-like enzyme